MTHPWIEPEAGRPSNFATGLDQSVQYHWPFTAVRAGAGRGGYRGEKRRSGGRNPEGSGAFWCQQSWRRRHFQARQGKVLTTGLDLQSELLANHGLKSFYGGDGAELDDIQLDTKAHRVVERTFGVFRVNGGKVSQLARFDLGGANFELLP